MTIEKSYFFEAFFKNIHKTFFYVLFHYLFESLSLWIVKAISRMNSKCFAWKYQYTVEF